MKPEPLKNKTYPFIELLHDYEKRIIAKQDRFVYEGHVRSAVQGLKREISKELKKSRNEMAEHIKNSDFSNEAFTSGYMHGLKISNSFIDKWFEDVIE